MAILDDLCMFHKQESVSRVVDLWDVGIEKGAQCLVMVECVDDPQPDEDGVELVFSHSDLATGPFTEVQRVAYNPSNGPLEFHLAGNNLQQFGTLELTPARPWTLVSSVILPSGQSNK